MPLRSLISPDARRIMDQAFKELQKSVPVDDWVASKHLTLKDVSDAAYKIEEQLAARQQLRNMSRLMPLFRGFDYFSQAVGGLCVGTPYLTSLWAPLQVIIKRSSQYLHNFEKILTAYTRMAETLIRFETYDRSLSTRREVQHALALFYADIIHFHTTAYEYAQRAPWQLAFVSSSGRFQRRFETILEDLRAHEDLVDKTARCIDLAEARRVREKIQEWRQEELDRLTKSEQETAASQYLALVTLLAVDDSNQSKIFDNIQADIEDTPGSCSWALAQVKIKSWASLDKNTRYLVLHGHPGTGKSVLATQLSQFLHTCGSSQVLVHYCTYTYADSMDYEQILRSLLLQLIRSQPDLIQNTYDWLVLQKKPLKPAILQELMRNLLNTIVPSGSTDSPVYIHIIIDGLHECDGSTQLKVIRLLDKIEGVQPTSVVCKILLSTRMTDEIGGAVRRRHQVSLNDEKESLNKAIKMLASTKLRALTPRFSQMKFTDTEVSMMREGIVEKADGMILWAKLVLDFLAKNIFYTKEEVLTATRTLPKRLSSFYGGVLSRAVANLDERSTNRMRTILGWIAFARRPLRSAELRSALTYSSNDEQIQELIPEYVLDMCGPLIERRKDTTYSLIHASVKDFLQSSDCPLKITNEDATNDHGPATVRCLSSGLEVFVPSCPAKDRQRRVLQGVHAFHIYATEYWVDYLIAMSQAESTRCLHRSQMLDKSSKLAEALGFTADDESTPADREELLDSWSIEIKRHDTRLYKMARDVLSKRKMKSLPPTNAEILRKLIQPQDLASLKLNYQYTIREILECPTHPAISIPDLERFKQECRRSAFTCQLPSCPFATTGFSTQTLLSEHENKHLKHPCQVPGCQYPVFGSPAALKRHSKECHQVSGPRKSIRTSKASRDIQNFRETMLDKTFDHPPGNPQPVYSSGLIQPASSSSQGQSPSQAHSMHHSPNPTKISPGSGEAILLTYLSNGRQPDIIHSLNRYPLAEDSKYAPVKGANRTSITHDTRDNQPHLPGDITDFSSDNKPQSVVGSLDDSGPSPRQEIVISEFFWSCCLCGWNDMSVKLTMSCLECSHGRCQGCYINCLEDI